MKKLPTYVSDLEHWADNNQQFQELNKKYGITDKLTEQARSLPSRLSSRAVKLGSITVDLLEHLLAAITVLRPDSSYSSKGAGWSSEARSGCVGTGASAPAVSRIG